MHRKSRICVNKMLKTAKLSEITFDKNIYPRHQHDPALVQRYAETMESIEAHQKFISVDAKDRLIDGRHRYLAYKTLYLDDPDHEIQVDVYPVSEDKDSFALAVELNSDFGWQMTDDDKKMSAIKMYQAYSYTQDEVAKRLKIGKGKVSQWLKDILENERAEREQKIWDLWLGCYSQVGIVKELDISKSVVSEFLQKSSAEFYENDSELFRNFEPQLYTVWNFPKATNKVKHFGNIPPEIIDNLLYYYTKPFDVIFDPFGGGGSTIDVCIERKRRYYVSDLTPIPARQDIRMWDITQGLPGDLPAVEVWNNYAQLRDEGWTQQRIAEAVGIDRSEVSRRLKYHRLPDQIKRYVEQKIIEEGHLKEITSGWNVPQYFSPWLTSEQVWLELTQKATHDKSKNESATQAGRPAVVRRSVRNRPGH